MIAEYARPRSIRVTPAQDAWLVDQSAARETSINELVRQTIKAAMATQEIKDPGGA